MLHGFFIPFTGERTALAIILLPSLLREDASLLFENFGERQHPKILCNGQVTTLVKAVNSKSFKVKVDSVVLTTTSDIVTAIQILFASFYIFNICYPAKLSAFFSQKEVINMEDSAPPISKVITLIKKVKSHL